MTTTRRDDQLGGEARDAALQRALVKAAPQLAWVNRPDGTVAFFNGRWYAYTGQVAPAPGGDPGSSWLEAVHPDARSRACSTRACHSWRATP